MTMPEAAVNEDDLAAAAKYEIGLSGKSPVVQSVSKAHAVYEPTNDHLGPSIVAFDEGHSLAAFRARQGICHLASRTFTVC